MVQFEDGSIKAQMGLPDMRLPIQYALSYPQRIVSLFPRFDFEKYTQLNFEQIDGETFKNFTLAKNAMHKRGNTPCILNAANEIAVETFLKNRVGFLEMSDIIASAMAKMPFMEALSIDDYMECDREARRFTSSLIKKEATISL